MCSETARVDVGLAVELWNKGMLWDKLMGTHWLPLTTVKQSSKVTQYFVGPQKVSIQVGRE